MREREGGREIVTRIERKKKSRNETVTKKVKKGGLMIYIEEVPDFVLQTIFYRYMYNMFLLFLYCSIRNQKFREYLYT